MKTSRFLLILILALCMILSRAKVGNAAPMGTAFTYQGHLYDANHVANGLYDFQFRIFDDPNEWMGTQIGLDVDMNDVSVIDGYFTVELDFNEGVFTGEGRWLEIGVRPGDQNDLDPYTTLTPMQKITPAPYAMYAESSGSDGGGVPVPLELSGSVSSPSAIIKGTITSGTGYGVMGQHNGGKWGILGSSIYAVAGRDDVSENYGYIGSSSEGVFGYSASGWAGRFQGKAKVEGDTYVTGRYYDSSSDAGTSGQILSSTGSGTNWITPEVSVPLSLSGTVAFPSSVISGNNTGTGVGIYGQNSAGNYGFLGGGYGAYGIHESSGNSGALGAYSWGVYGDSTSSVGVFGMSDSGIAVAGTSSSGSGVQGFSTSAIGVHGRSTGTAGVKGEWGINNGNYGYLGTGSYAVYGNSSSGYAGYFDGKCYVSGNLGVGTTTPAGKLDVNGSIYQRGGVLHADYVFEPDYKLETIEEHSKFMWQNKHLSALPKAKVDENGFEIVEVGSHRKGIVEELEKAHIYIEQLHNRNKVLEERLAKLEAAVAQINVLPQGEMK